MLVKHGFIVTIIDEYKNEKSTNWNYNDELL